MSAFDFAQLCSWDYLVACTVATEVPPNAPEAEFKAVIDVMRNRVKSKKWGKRGVNVVLAKHQFSAVCREDYWINAITGDWQPKHVEKCYNLWVAGWPDTTKGATHYYSPISMNPKWSEPKWAKNMTEIKVDGVRPDYFRFFKEK